MRLLKELNVGLSHMFTTIAPDNYTTSRKHCSHQARQVMKVRQTSPCLGLLKLIIVFVIVHSAGVFHDASGQLIGHVDPRQTFNAPKVCKLLVAIVAR